MDVMIDLEALGKAAGSAITELAAVAFDMETGKIAASFSRIINPDLHSPPFTADLDTLNWHLKNGSWPRSNRNLSEEIGIDVAIRDFLLWFNGLQPVETVWSWGWDYDRPIIEAAFELTNSGPLPWRYHCGACARSVWRGAFPGVKRPARAHSALEDAVAAVGDLRKALGKGI